MNIHKNKKAHVGVSKLMQDQQWIFINLMLSTEMYFNLYVEDNEIYHISKTC